MINTTNSDRAAWASDALDTFSSLVYHPETTEPIATRIKDLMTNLLHLARLNGVEDVEALADNAVLMHNMERDEDED